MKRLIIYTFLFAGLLSCKKDFLAPPPVSVVDAKAIFGSQLQAAGFLANIYTELTGGLDEFGNGQGFTQMCDEGEAGYPYLTTNGINVGSFDGSNNPDNIIAAYYRKIRKCNVLLANKDLMTFDPALKAQYVAEAQFLRAFFYSELIKRYAGIPLVVSPVSYEEIQDAAAQQAYKKNLKRASYANCIDFVVKQLDSAASVLPWAPVDDLQRGKATAAAAIALKAKVLLFAASPLSNVTQPNNLIGYTTYDANRWKLAADAAREFFTKNTANGNWYGLYTGGFDKLFTEGRDAANKEMIFYRQGNSQTVTFFNSPNRLGGFSHFNISLNLVDKFEMKTGIPINEAGSGYDEQQWFANRDPRLAFTILRNGELWKGITTQYYFKDEAGKPGLDWGTQFMTGVLMKKFQRSDGSTTPIKWHYLRLADVYLMLAEAENEFGGPSPEVYTALNTIRNRPSVLMPALPNGLTKEQMRTRIQNERAVEMAFESQRFFDVRRWKTAEVIDNSPLQGFTIEKNGSNFISTRYTLETRKFTSKMYLYPFPEAEIFKGADIVQNPGY